MDYYEKYMKYKNKYLHAKHTLGYDMSGGADPSKCYIFFQDVADADNFMSVVAFIQLFGRPTLDYPIHFVLTQRPENLGVPKAYKDGPINEELFTLDNYIHGPDDKTDALLVAQDGVRRFITFMHKNYNIGKTLAEAYNLIRVYDGGLPSMSSNISHLAHKRDYLFDRADLLTHPREIGDLITAEEYAQLEVMYNDDPFDTPDPEKKPKNYVYDENKKTAIARQTILRGVIKLALDKFEKEIGRDNTHILRPLSELPRWINTKNTELSRMKSTIRVIAFLLAPLTGFANLFEIDKDNVLITHLTHVYGQLFAWDNAVRVELDDRGIEKLNELGKPVMDPDTYTINPNAVNILRNQFNIDCDTQSFDNVKRKLDLCKSLDSILWIPTEMLKGGPENTTFYKILYNLRSELPQTPLIKLWSQWSGIKNDGQTIFDPSVIFVAHDIVNNMQSSPMITKKLLIEYIKHDKEKYMRKFPSQKTGPLYNRPVYQIKETQSSTKHSAVRELNVNEHYIRLIKLLLNKITSIH